MISLFWAGARYWRCSLISEILKPDNVCLNCLLEALSLNCQRFQNKKQKDLMIDMNAYPETVSSHYRDHRRDDCRGHVHNEYAKSLLVINPEILIYVRSSDK